MTDRELCKRLRDTNSHITRITRWGYAVVAADRIEELNRELARANQRIGLFLHHASKKKKKAKR
jgi:hypothetical protein